MRREMHWIRFFCRFYSGISQLLSFQPTNYGTRSQDGRTASFATIQVKNWTKCKARKLKFRAHPTMSIVFVMTFYNVCSLCFRVTAWICEWFELQYDFCYYILLKRKCNLYKTTWSFEESQRVCVNKAWDLYAQHIHISYMRKWKTSSQINPISIQTEWIWASPCALLLVCWDIFLLRAFYLMNSGGGNPRRPFF